MKTLTPEEYKAKYGADALSGFKAVEEKRYTTNPVQNAVAGAVDAFSGAGRTIQTLLPKSLSTVPAPGGAKTANEIGREKRLEDLGADPDALSTKVGEFGGEVASVAGPGGVAKTAPLAAKIAGQAAFGGGTGYIYDIGQKLAKTDEEGEDPSLATFKPGMSTALGLVTGPLGPGAGKLSGLAADKARAAAEEAARTAGKIVTNSPVVRGAMQIGTEFAERVPRFISKKQATIRDAATKAERIANSPAPIGNALKAGVDERIVNTIEQADEPTRKGYNEIVRLAEESIDTSGTLKTTARPEIVAGEAAANQYKLIDQQRKKIGSEIGAAVKALDNQQPVSMVPAYSTLHEALKDAGVDLVEADGGKAVISFGKSGYTKAQRAKINELYELATEGGEELTAAQIHAKDRLFSQLQREARMEGIGDIVVDTAEGPMSLFRVFRDTYSEALEQVAPEIKPLNKQYRNLVTFTDDIESSIVKTGKFETNSKLDPSEYAQTSLRRLFSEAASAADYRAIADEMDEASRALGYEGAKPEQLARFAYEIRKIFPETTPRTGFEGSIKGVGDIISHVMGAGKADLSDQQKALRELVDSFGDLPD